MADDDEEDCMLANEALATTGISAGLTCVSDGAELISLLKRLNYNA
jgi:hypothetical protein